MTKRKKRVVELDFTPGSPDLRLLVGMALAAEAIEKPDQSGPVDVRAWEIACRLVRLVHAKGDREAMEIVMRTAHLLVHLDEPPSFDDFQGLLTLADQNVSSSQVEGE